MKKVLISTVVTALAMSFAVSADAAQKHKVSADVQASCEAQAAKKYSAIHFIKRHNFVNDCVARHAKASPNATTGQATSPKSQSMTPAPEPKASKTNQAPKQSQ
jgi:hypothetical protein